MTALQAAFPIAAALPAWVPFAFLVRHGRRCAAAGVVLAWAVVLSTSLAALEAARPGTCAGLAPGAGSYGAEMLRWARTGEGCESRPGCWLGQHALHAGGVAVGALVSGGAGALVLAAVLMVWMGAYTGALAAASPTPALAAALGWHPWALVRVVAMIALGVALAEPMLRPRWRPDPTWFRWLFAGVAGLIVDGLLKLILAPVWWRLVIRPLLG